MITGLSFIVLTLGSYWGAKLVYKKWNIPFFSPLLIAPSAIIVVLLVGGISYDSYNAGAKWLTEILQPATIALAIPLYRYFPVLKKYLREIFISVLFGSTLAVMASFSLAGLVHLNKGLISSIIPYSVTTPIAMGVSEKIGGIPAITAVFVILTGITGLILGPWTIRMFRFHSDIAKGILLGTSSHGAGTSKALELGSISGAVSSVCMVLAAILTFVISPWIYMHVFS
ncbi:CidB/LrgB family autolysis modulator [Virgibacillus halophilus]|uniref:CidB/LrgB family autolysis modulator n=1 Tax=Tigheibacillus halophilus TaxID=361280 RepID=A0ABU5C587_9BACI|nr:CidB/LrgB family autolysis modulator [Virgibacillus halophilus]